MTKTDRPRAGLASKGAARMGLRWTGLPWAGALLGLMLMAAPAGAQPAPALPPGVPPVPGAPMPPASGAPMQPMPSHGMQMPPPAQGANPAYVQGYRDSMERMNRGMAISPSANPDRDFAAGMIPHHQGAIDMARLELRYGHDPKLRKMAQEIIRAQEREIAELKRWLAAHPH